MKSSLVYDQVRKRLEENNISFDITDNETLERIINKYIYQDVLESKKHYQAILSFFNRKAKSLKEYKNFIYKNTDLVLEYEKLIQDAENIILASNEEKRKKIKKNRYYMRFGCLQIYIIIV